MDIHTHTLSLSMMCWYLTVCKPPNTSKRLIRLRWLVSRSSTNTRYIRPNLRQISAKHPKWLWWLVLVNGNAVLQTFVPKYYYHQIPSLWSLRPKVLLPLNTQIVVTGGEKWGYHLTNRWWSEIPANTYLTITTCAEKEGTSFEQH